MNKVKLGAILTLLVLPVAALAINNPVPNPTGAQVSSINELINNVLNGIWIVFGAIAVIMFIIAGVLFLAAQGNPEKVAQARQAFLWGVAGVVVGIIAYSIIAIVGTFIGK
jgi:hypothetical protein